MGLKRLLSSFLIGALAAGTSAVLSAAHADFTKPHVAGELIVKFKDQKANTQLLTNLSAAVAHQYKTGAMLLKLKSSLSGNALEQVARELLDSDQVVYAEPNYIININKLPNDPDFSKLYGLHNEGETGGTPGADIDAPEAWDVTTGSKNVLVGIIDTGVDYTHPDIAPNYWTNPGETGTDDEGNDKTTNGIDDDNNGFVDDWRGWNFVGNNNDPKDDHNHGTHVAGTIGASGDDGVGVVGVNWSVSMVGIKFLSASGSGSTDGAIKSIEYATTIGADITNNSWGGGGFSQALFDAIKANSEAGSLFVAAAGNSSSNNDSSPHYPSSYDVENIIAVASTDSKDQLSYFSCYGASSVDIAAPGQDIFSTTKNGEYASYSGTSMATPHVAGVAALVKSVFPDSTPVQMKERILNTADPLPSLTGKVATGARLNAANSLEIDNIPFNTVSGIALIEQGMQSIIVEWAPAGDDGDQGQARRYEVRVSDDPIVTEEDWANATPANIAFQTTDSDMIRAEMAGLDFNSSGHFAVQAFDNVGNAGPVSESFAFEVARVQVVMQNHAETLDGVVADQPWGLETVEGRSVFSDSPGEKYGANLDASLTMDTFSIEAADAVLVVDMFFDLESGYDFGYIEVLPEGSEEWQTLEKFSGKSKVWEQKIYDLADVRNDSKNIQVRFRITSDKTVSREGVLIDSVRVIAPVAD